MQVADRASFFEQGIRAAVEGNRPLARLHLESALRTDAFNPDTWLWLGWTADSPGHAASCFEQVRHLQPDHPLAALGLQWSHAMRDAAQQIIGDPQDAFPLDDSADDPPRQFEQPPRTEARVEQRMFDVERLAAESVCFDQYSHSSNEEFAVSDDLNDGSVDGDFDPSVEFFESDTDELVSNVNHELESLSDELVAAFIEDITELDPVTVEDSGEGDTVDESCPPELMAHLDADDLHRLICLDDETRSITLADADSSIDDESNSSEVPVTQLLCVFEDEPVAVHKVPEPPLTEFIPLPVEPEPTVLHETIEPTMEVETPVLTSNEAPAEVTSNFPCGLPDSLFESLFDATCSTATTDETTVTTLTAPAEHQAESSTNDLEATIEPLVEDDLVAETESVEVINADEQPEPSDATCSPMASSSTTLESTLVEDVPSEILTAPTVLVADDSPTVRKLMAATLRTHGFDVVEAIDGVDAVKALGERRPDLILLDINMPKLDGFQLCRLVKKHAATRHIPVLMLSGKQDPTDRAKGQLVGCSAYFTKPFEPDQIAAAVKQHLASKATAT